MSKPAILVFLFLMTYQTLSAQQIGGTVTDTATRVPLAYVHIGIPGKGIGTISDENGQFRLHLNKDHHADTITFSMIGYRSLQLAVTDLLYGHTEVGMEASITQLKEVVVRSDKLREPLRFGRTKPTKTTTGASGINTYGIGQEIGTTIKNDNGKYLIDAISFHHRWNTVDSILYRINIYTLKNELPDTSILQKELFVMSCKGDKWVTKQVEGEVVVFDQDVFVSIELIRRWNNEGENLLFYSHGKGHSECRSFIRPASLAEWTTDSSFPLTLYLTVEKLE